MIHRDVRFCQNRAGQLYSTEHIGKAMERTVTGGGAASRIDICSCRTGPSTSVFGCCFDGSDPRSCLLAEAYSRKKRPHGGDSTKEATARTLECGDSSDNELACVF